MLAAVGYRRVYSSSRWQCGHSMIVVLFARSCLTRAVLGMRCPHHEQKLYSSLAETMNTRRRGGVGFPVVSCLSSCLLALGALASSSSRSAWIAHCPNVRSLPGATCRCRSNLYSRSVEVGRAGLVISLPSSVSVSRSACLYSRVICGALSSPCVSSSVGVCLSLVAGGLRVPALIVSPGGDGLGARAAVARKTGTGCFVPRPLACLAVVFYRRRITRPSRPIL